MTKYRLVYVAVLSVSVALSACSSDDPAGGADAGNNPSVDASLSGPDATPGVWETLISGDWTMSDSTEKYVCVRKTINEDMYIHEFEAINPLGTHHTVLTVGAPNGADGTFPCNAGTNASAMIFGSGVGGDPVKLPDGVAMKIEAGQQLVLNLHLFNVSGGELADLSGTKVKTIPASEVDNIAEVVLAGSTFLLRVPAGITTQTGTCTLDFPATIYGISPHMHQLGIAMKITAERAGQEPTVLFDDLYTFYEQRAYAVDPIQMAAGDKIIVECTYNNTTGSEVTFGDSSTEEMCFGSMARYPAAGRGFICDDNIPF